MAIATLFKLGNAVVNSITTITAISIIGFSGYMVYDNYKETNKAYNYNVMAYKPDIEASEVSLQEIYEINPDTVAWLTVDNTHIDYPVVQSTDDIYYVNRDIYKNASLSGTLYLQAKNNKEFKDSYNLIYGHHMDGGAMFGDITNFLEEDYFNSHQTGTVITLSKAYSLEVIACCNTNSYVDSIYNRTALTEEEYKSLKEDPEVFVMQENTKNANKAVKYLVLSTCYGVATDGRTILICKITEIPDTPVNPPKPPRVVKTGSTTLERWGVLNLIAIGATFLTFIPYLRVVNDEKKKIFARLGIALSVVLTLLSVFIFCSVEHIESSLMAISDNYTFVFMLIFGIALLVEEITTKKKTNKKLTLEENLC